MHRIALIVLQIVFVFSNDVEKAFKDNEITPDIVTTAPTGLVTVIYEKSSKTVNLGNELTPNDVKDRPKIAYPAETNEFYTLLMTDPDAPSRQTHLFREWQHWLIVNIPGSAVDEGEELADYLGAGPPKSTGLHRYVFLLFKQPKKMEFQQEFLGKKDKKRAKFHTDEFVKKYGLEGPVAGNFFQAQYDDYVPLMYKELGMDV